MQQYNLTKEGHVLNGNNMKNILQIAWITAFITSFCCIFISVIINNVTLWHISALTCEALIFILLCLLFKG